MSEKYKLQELARDLGLASREVTELLSEHYDTPKKNTASLNGEELNVVFEQLTQSHEEESFDRYFGMSSYTLIDRADPVKPRKPKTAPKAEEPKQAASSPRPAEAMDPKSPSKQEEAPAPAVAAAPAPKAEKPAYQTVQAGGQTVTIRMPGMPMPPVQEAAPAAAEPKPAAEPVAVKEPMRAPRPIAHIDPPPKPAPKQAAAPARPAERKPQQAAPAKAPETKNAEAPRPQQSPRPAQPAAQNRPQAAPANAQRPQNLQQQMQRPQNPQQAQRPQAPQQAAAQRPQNPQQAARPQQAQRPQQAAPQGQRPQQFGNQPRPQNGTSNGPRPQQAARPQQGQPAQRPAPAPRPQPARNYAPQPVANINVAMPGQVRTQKPAGAQPQKQSPKQRTVPAGESRTVDTRAAHVDLDKYNEKYEQIAPSLGGRKTPDTKKQKLNQKSQQRKPFGARRETEADKLKRLALEKARKQQLKVSIPDQIAVGDLASRLKVTASEVIKRLIPLGIMASINEVVDFDTAELVATELGAKVEHEIVLTIEERLFDESEDASENLEERSPIVVVMGHVDHGKTSLLDYIRKTKVTATEAGGITQHIGAYRVQVGDKMVTFLDTPGHEAFTSMRARGAQITDIAVLVVAADDGIMPQTVEAINHAKAAGVSIIVAINKIDKEAANIERVKQELTQYELVPEEWGGDVICVPVSAVTGEGVDDLLENLTLVADFKELKANPHRLAKGTVIEARLDKGRGPVSTILVQNGTLHTGDVIIAGTTVGHVRMMTNDRGETVTEAGPSVPVEITGLSEVPSAGDIFNAVEDERLARELVEQRRTAQKEEQFSAYQKVTLDNLFSQIEQGEMKELGIIVKADVQGSVEAVRQSLEKLSNEEVRVRVIHGGVGAVNESDVMLASASNAIIVGFNVRPVPIAVSNAAAAGVEIRLYRVIYDCIEEIEAAMRGMLTPKTREVELGRAEIRLVYRISSVGNIAGCYVLEGKITRSAQIRVVRQGIIVSVDRIGSLRRMKDDVREVAQGYECGIGLEKFNDIKEGDVLEAFEIEEYTEA